MVKNVSKWLGVCMGSFFLNMVANTTTITSWYHPFSSMIPGIRNTGGQQTGPTARTPKPKPRQLAPTRQPAHTRRKPGNTTTTERQRAITSPFPRLQEPHQQGRGHRQLHTPTTSTSTPAPSQTSSSSPQQP